MKIYVNILLFLSFPFALCAQKEANIWYFGKEAGLNFNNSPPTALTDSKINTLEGCSSISDSAGNLLFYTDGIKVWNRTHVLMPDGDVLNGHPSSTHAAVIARQPKSQLYYIFTTSAVSPFPNYGVWYSVVDMQSDGGKGDIVQKNVPLYAFSAEKIAGVGHKNSKDVWIAGVQLNTDTLYVYQLTENGLSSAIKQNMGVTIIGTGQIKFSVNGDKLAFVNRSSSSSIYLFDFDNSTGWVSNRRRLSGFRAIYGLELSPSGNYLYTTSENIGDTLFQCPIANVTANTSKDTLCSVVTISNGLSMGQLQLAPDKKIYLSAYNQPALSVINYPDSAGPKSGFSLSTVNLGGKNCLLGLPTVVSSYLYRREPYITADTHCKGEPITISLNDVYADSIRWDFGDAKGTTSTADTVVHTYPDSGLYLITAYAYTLYGLDTVTHTVRANAVPKPLLGPDTLLCSRDSIAYNVYHPSIEKYIWNTGDTNSAYTITADGTYWVQAAGNGCTNADTVVVKMTDCTLSSQNHCLGDTTLFTLNSTPDSVLWDFGDGKTSVAFANTIRHFYTSGGTYTAVATVYINGLHRQITTPLTITALPFLELGTDTVICSGKPFHSGITDAGVSFYWDDGTTNASVMAVASGMYALQIEKGGCKDFDTVNITVTDCSCDMYFPDAFTPNNNHLNETFAPVTDCIVQNYFLQVYTRWGELIFESNNIQMGWEGLYKGQACPDGTYIWVVRYKSVYTERKYTQKGIVILIR